MIGNDIVDYSVDEKKYLNQRYVSRCLSQLESNFLVQNGNKNALFWTLWACKEAAYKAYQQQHLSCKFSPPKFELSETTLIALSKHDMKSVFQGEIHYQSHSLSFQLTWPALDVVHCIAAQNLTSIEPCLVAIENNHAATDNIKQSHFTRTLAKKLLMEQGIDAEIFRPELDMGHYRKPGPPILIDNTTKTKRKESISLSHDKTWLAFVVSKT
ncbi:4'-phosphopantetheinyl transferase superfamily protein [Marinicella rhabdoformis]|uniref:4'-phosphopantetheinyl transferase superfamily protein n=1 Tax=Marinicella rhabdoformis TaxID=2580566 RepID=UPI0012AEB9E6|nr:4'-phosphopantetheinyl transferase superfamily protein [Marinicella rhabdoformis]